MAKVGVLAIPDADEGIQKINAYFESRTAFRYVYAGMKHGEKVFEKEEYMKPPTVAGLCLALNITRQTLMRYGRGEGERDPKLLHAVAQAKLRCAEWWEEALAVREASNGARFALEANFGYGKDDDGEDGTGDGFEMNTISPVASEAEQLAIPKWEAPEDE